MDADECGRIEQGRVLIGREIRATDQSATELEVEISGKSTMRARNGLRPREVEIMLAGGLINRVRAKKRTRPGGRLMSKRYTLKLNALAPVPSAGDHGAKS